MKRIHQMRIEYDKVEGSEDYLFSIVVRINDGAPMRLDKICRPDDFVSQFDYMMDDAKHKFNVLADRKLKIEDG